jgi:hypothetical protein
VKSVSKTGVNVAGCFYEEKNRDFNGYNGAGRRNRAAVMGEQDLKSEITLEYCIVGSNKALINEKLDITINHTNLHSV